MLLEQLAKAEHDARAAQGRLGGPGGKRSLRGGDGSVELGAIGQRHQRLHLTAGGVEDFGGAAGGSGGGVAVDPVRNCAQACGRVSVDTGKNYSGHWLDTSVTLE